MNVVVYLPLTSSPSTFDTLMPLSTTSSVSGSMSCAVIASPSGRLNASPYWSVTVTSTVTGLPKATVDDFGSALMSFTSRASFTSTVNVTGFTLSFSLTDTSTV